MKIEAKDLTEESKAFRNQFSENALKKLLKQKPAPLTSKKIFTYYSRKL